MALSTTDIINYMRPFQKKNVFVGVFPCDCLPRKVRLPAAFIINSSPKKSLKGHWLGLYIGENGTAEYFDSFGFPPKQKEIQQFIRLHAKRLVFNNKQIQHLSSVKCGKFVIVFMIVKLFKKPFKQLIQKFSSNLMVNDILIENIFNYFMSKNRI